MKKLFLLFAVLSLAVYAAAQMREIIVPGLILRYGITDKNIAEEIKYDGIIILFPDSRNRVYGESDAVYKYYYAKKKYQCSSKVKTRPLNYKENPYAWSFFKEQFTNYREPYVLVLKTDTNTTTNNIAEKIIKNFSGEADSYTIENNIKETFEAYCK